MGSVIVKAYNSVMHGLCKTAQTDRAIDFLGHMGYCIKVPLKEALELQEAFGARGLVKDFGPLCGKMEMQQDYACNWISVISS
ncbi:hypothetical protein AKJ16_DCAP08319 [Drosera capensis]